VVRRENGEAVINTVVHMLMSPVSQTRNQILESADEASCVASGSRRELLNCDVPEGSILGPLFFLIYINDLPTIVNNNNYMVLFADDTSIIITDTNRRDFNINANQTFQDINTWFKVNLLTLNHNKTQY